MAGRGRQRALAAAPRDPNAVPGLRRPCLESGRAWASATRQEEARAILAMSRRGGRSKVYRELLRQCRDGVSPADVRAVSSIAARLGILDRQVRKHLAALEADGVIVTVHHAGIRLPGQRGWTTNVYVMPALLGAVPLLPPGARAKARKLLLSGLVRTALMTRGYARQLRDAIGAPEEPPAAAPSVSSPRRPPDNLSISTPMGLGSDFVSAGSSFTVPEITIVPPYPPGRLPPVDNSGPEREVRATARTDSEPAPVAGPEGRDRSWVSTGSVWPCVDGDSATRRPTEATTRRTARELRGLKPSQVVSILEVDGEPRSEAIHRATGFARVQAWRRFRRAHGRAEGRKPRWRSEARAVQLELNRLRDEERLANRPVEHADVSAGAARRPSPS